MKTYDEILAAMKNAFFEHSGRNVDNMGDICARFESVASELFSLGCQNEFLMKQAFPQTATGEYLDRHGAMRDISRGKGARAKGTLRFLVSQPATDDIIVPMGTVCSSWDKPYIQYATDADCVIASGATSAIMTATALEVGSEYNCDAGTISQIVNIPTGVESVTNSVAFRGGCDNECDEHLRSRIMDSFALSNGVSRQYMEALAMQLDFVLDCKVCDGQNSSVTVYVRTPDNSITNAQVTQVKYRLLLFSMLCQTINVVCARESSYDLKIDATQCSAQPQEIKDIVKSICDGVRIGEDIDLDYLEYRLSQLGYCRVSSDSQIGRRIICDTGAYLSLQNCEVLTDE